MAVIASREIPPGAIFVFGSNVQGRHGKGAALEARLRYGAVYGQGTGRQGQSYAIATRVISPRTAKMQTLSLSSIKVEVEEFLDYARAHATETFFVTRVGCGLAGYTDAEIAPLFRGHPANCLMPTEWKELINGG